MTVKRYALARPGVAKACPDEGVRRLRLVRMEAIAELDRDREQLEKGRAADPAVRAALVPV
jgi:hypothetical protein